MAQIRPFKGYRFKLGRPIDLCNVIAPPYDMLDSAMVNDLYKKDGHNTVRITQNRPEPADTANRDRHRRAAAIFREWTDSGVIARDPEPSVYVYEQQFTVDRAGTPTAFTRTGAIVLVKLVDFSDGIVLPHEQTLSGPKQDRYELLDETRVNTGQIFGLLDDAGDGYEAIRSCRTGEPVGRCDDENGVIHTLYRCTNSAAIGHLLALAAPRTVLIADGHHRYETALKFHRDNQGIESYGWTMMTIVSMADPGLVIRPFHRLVRTKSGAEGLDMVRELSHFFDLIDLGSAQEGILFEFLRRPADGRMLYADTGKKRVYEIVLNSAGEDFLKRVLPEKLALWRHLDVSKINQIVISGILGLELDGHVLHDMIDYVNDARAGLNRVLSDSAYYGGFFVRPIDIRSVSEIVAAGERMPQKSTNFYPKLYSGLVFNRLDDK